MTIAEASVVFALGFLVGTLAILLGARLVVDEDAGVGNAAFTAFVGAVVWAGSGLFIGWIPLVGTLLMLLAWIAVINWRYPGGLATAASVGFVAWLAAIVLATILSAFGLITLDVVGIPEM